MYYVYLIFTEKSTERSIYIGYTSNLKRRLNDHNLGKVKSTRNKGPWELIYYEAYFSEDDARQREKKLKHHGKGLQELKKRLNQSFKQI